MPHPNLKQKKNKSIRRKPTQENENDLFNELFGEGNDDFMDEDEGCSGSCGAKPDKKGKKNLLEQFSTELTEKARKGEIDPLIGRKDIIKRSTQILARRFKNNICFVGDPGVGKTAIIEGLAKSIVEVYKELY